MDELVNQWKKAKEDLPPLKQSMQEISKSATKKKREVLYAHYGTIVILSITLIVISYFFIYVAPFRDLLSRIGVALMTGGLTIRIILELFSIIRSNKIHLSGNAAQITASALSFYQFRKKVHGPVTITIVALYILGFYMLMPEFSKYIELVWMIVLCFSAIPISVFLIWQIKKGIRQEMKTLHEIAQISTQLTEEHDVSE